MSDIYTKENQILCLNLLSNISGLYGGTTEEIEKSTDSILNDILSDKEVIKLIGNWKIEWGPGVFQVKNDENKSRRSPSAPPDNTLFVARSDDYPNEYIVSVAGTVDSSTYDWLVEDADWKLVNWADDNSSKGKIANGIKTGLQHLLEIKPSIGQNPGKTIVDFFHGKTNPVIITTGHSLGGSLAPALALHLKDKVEGLIRCNISTYSTAGVTFCDKVLAKHLNETLGEANVYRIWNDNDLVPNCWTAVPGYFDKYRKVNGQNRNTELLNWLDRFKRIWVLIKDELDNNHDIEQFAHIGTGNNVVKIEGVLYKELGMDLAGFFVEVTHQHVMAYIDAWKLTEIINIVARKTGKGFGDSCPQPLLTGIRGLIHIA